MKTTKKKGYLIAFILVLCFFFIVIASVHSYQNLINRTKPVSQNWARSTSLNVRDLYPKRPSILVDDKYTNVLMANKTNLMQVKINRATRQTEEKIINIKDVESYKVRDFKWDKNNIYVFLNNSLYFASMNANGEYSDLKKIADEIIDFSLINDSDKVTIAVAHINGIALYQEANGLFTKISEKYNIKKLSEMEVFRDNKGTIHIAALAEVNNVDNYLYYLTFADNEWTLKSRTLQRIYAELLNITNIEIAVDDEDVYIFYSLTGRNINAQTYYARIALYNSNADLKFEKLILLEGDKYSSDVHIGEVSILKEQHNEIKFTLVKDSYDKEKGRGFSGYLVSMDKGKLTNVECITNNQRVITKTVYQRYKNNDIFVYMDVAGEFFYEAFYTETGKEYFKNAITATQDDFYIAILNTIPGYINTIIITYVKLFLQFFVILWFVFVDIFNIKAFRERPRLTLAIGIVLYLIVKIAGFGTYYTPLALSQMPTFLIFNGARYVYASGFALISYLIMKLYKKHNPEITPIVEFIIFALIDAQYTSLFFMTYTF